LVEAALMDGRAVRTFQGGSEVDGEGWVAVEDGADRVVVVERRLERELTSLDGQSHRLAAVPE
jgi:hypothetical protein